MKKKWCFLLTCILSFMIGCQQPQKDVTAPPDTEVSVVLDDNLQNQENQEYQAEEVLTEIPEYSGSPYVVLNGNQPGFDQKDYTTEAFESYSELDMLGRCGVAFANIGKEIMPTEERGAIGMVKPSGWHTVKYDCVDGKYLYNRCHLIGYQLSGENANEQNLITGTRYMNVDGMLPFENQIDDYVEETGHHVLYRVTPVYDGDNLVASGVRMEAASVEDDEIRFHVYCYNVQPGVTINYADGTSRLSSEPIEEQKPEAEVVYIGNKNSKIFHKASCDSVSKMNPRNKAEFSSREDAVEQGYHSCKACNP